MKSKKNCNQIVFFTSFYPEGKTSRGPWGERFDGLYGRIFKAEKPFASSICWYSIAEKSLYSRNLNQIIKTKKGMFSFLLKELLRAFFSQAKTNFLIHYPCFRMREIIKNFFLIAIIKLFQRMPGVKVFLDFLEPPLLMPEFSNNHSFLKSIVFWVLRKQEKSYLTGADVIITGGDEMSQYLDREYGIGVGMFISIPQGVNISNFAHELRRSEKDSFTVFYGGTMSEDRGIKELFECMDRINRHHTVNLLCCGHVHQAMEITDRSWLEVRTNLSYYEYIGLITSRADVGILPYPVNDRWGKISISKLATYAAAGIPIISTALPHTEKFLRFWDCGRTANDWDGIEKLIIDLYQDRKLCRSLGENARKAAKGALDWPVLVGKLESILEFS